MTREFKTGLTTAAKGFGMTSFDVDMELEVVEYNYSETLDEIRNKLATDSQEILDQFPAGTPEIPLVTKLLKFQSDFDEDEMLYTHWLDVALYCTYYGEPIRIELAHKLNNLLKDAGNRRVPIVAHSLGTAVVYDTLDKFYQNLDPGEYAGDFPYLRTGGHNLKSLWTFANVNRLVNVLNEVAEVGETVVRSGPTGCTDFLYNVYHTLDPFTWFYSYNADSVDIESGRHFETKVVRKKNTHSFQEYIMDPEVAMYMLCGFINASAPLDPIKYQSYVDAHKAGTPQDIFERIESKVADLKDKAIEQPVKTLKDFFKELKAFSDAVKAVWEDEDTAT
jgi:hypothetical protein